MSATGRCAPLHAATPVLAAVRIAVATSRNGRRRNEDAIGIAGWVLYGDTPGPLEMTLPIEDGRPVVVALTDGMGGHPAGDLAAQIAADHLTRSAPSAVSFSEELGAAFQRADEAIHAAAMADRHGMACAASAVLIQASGEAVIANVGDVRVYRIVDGYVGQVTIDDRPATEPGEAPTGTVLRWLGGLRRTVVQEHRYRQPLAPGDRLIMCTDGLYSTVSLETMHRCVRGDVRSVATDLVAAASDCGDNVTVVVLELHGLNPATSSAGAAERYPIARQAASALHGILAPS